MSLFKKKENRKDKNIYMPFKAKKNEYPRRRKAKLNIFRRNKPNRENGKKALKFLLFMLLPIILVGLIYLSIKFVNSIRNNKEDDASSVGPVLGIADIPTYKYSEFIFQNNINDPSVSKFLSEGNSAYRLTSRKTIEDVFKHYVDTLPPLGWENVLTVPLGSEEQKYGQYWVKENRGLRIYSKFNDIWFESITKEDAQTGLAELIKKGITKLQI